MTKKLSWRLGKLPSPDEVRELVKDKIITQDEARSILFKTESDEERDSESLKTEIKFLRELVDKLSSHREVKVIEIIKEVEKPYYRFEWYQPYNNLTLVSGTTTMGTLTSTDLTTQLCSTSDTVSGTFISPSSFSSINNF